MSSKTSSALTIALTLAEIVVALATVAFVFLGMMDVSCLRGCDYGPMVFAFWLMAIMSALVVIGSLWIMQLRRFRGRTSVWVPVAGIGILVATYVLCTWLQTVGA